ncbi:similar to Saccharomyces cerevisiae YDR451C YHP1 One of two homeobox transcriptional repressors (see also Yox1p) [Maudiozyma saulgeensis]|uniref:Similar to Saccharomyces cerevisiae YDR451C YHP1 One of two homeobox transcriptional repressors (See also Yox1p) n=1 Tax=Maudiozyma saulgeensis TaxID=1789683 RepID=A0A1X7QX97_9SACH|nr:similar to Saccharomyces cerevisiae YDR451C YHP1 One of two homeobox transcriptional repressors (see also Yox1p) [Kazachstania saulgeensis]
MSNKKPLLPSLASLLTHEPTTSTCSAPSSPFFESYNKNSFRSDDQGIIRLPPLSATLASRPRSIESAVRQSSISSVVSAPALVTSTSTLSQLPTSDNELKTPASSSHYKINAANSIATTTSNVTTMSTPFHQPPSPRHMNQKFSVNTPSTPMVKTKTPRSNRKKIDMLTPFTAVKASITPSSNEKKRAFAFITHSQETFGVKEPKIDNAPLARRKRRRTSVQELNILQAGFENCPTPDKKQRLALAERCSMTEKAVQIWFQNKRQAVKRQRLALSKPISTSNDNNDDKCDTELHEQSTPLAPKSSIDTDSSNADLSLTDNSIPSLSISYQKNQTTPTRKTKNFSPTKRSPTPTRGRGQALTFHLKTDKKILTPMKTSPNNKVNKLINGYNDSILNQHRHNTSSENKFLAGSPSKKSSKSKLEFKTSLEKTPLKEINTNIIKS